MKYELHTVVGIEHIGTKEECLSALEKIINKGANYILYSEEERHRIVMYFDRHKLSPHIRRLGFLITEYRKGRT